MYILESSAELISYEYNENCTINAYQESVKNLKILIEIVGPEPIWEINFSNDDTDLVNIIRANLSEEPADKLISLLNEKPYSNQTLDEDIFVLLSQMYTNMYGEDIKSNVFISNLLGGNEIKNRYYFNSDLIEKEIPYTEYSIATHYYAYIVSSNPILVTTDKLLDKNSKELFIISKNNIKINSLKDLTDEMIKENEIKFYYHGEEISYNSINLSMYKNEYITMFTTIIMDPNGLPKSENKYLPTIYESFPDQRIGENTLKNNTF